MVCSSNVSDEFEDVVHDVSNDFMDCINVIQNLIDKIVSIEAIQLASNIVSCVKFQCSCFNPYEFCERCFHSFCYA